MMLLTYQHSYSVDDVNLGMTESQSVILKGMEDGTMRPVISLTDTHGEILSKAYSLGVPQLFRSDLKAVEASDPMIYVNVDSLLLDPQNKLFDESNNKTLIKQIYDNLDRGFQVVLESKDYYMEDMESFIEFQFPNIVKLSEMENAVIIEKNNDGYTMVSVHPTEMLLNLGIPYEYSTEFEMKKALETYDAIEKETKEDDSKASRATLSDRSLLRFAISAYVQNPTDSAFATRYNTTNVKVWSKKFAPLGDCIIAWKGSDNAWDWAANIGSQLAWGRIDRTPSPYEGYGPRTFVNRVNGVDATIHNILRQRNCKKVYITGHSLGGALSQIHGVSLAANNNGNQPYLLSGIVTFNSPNAVTNGTRTKFRAGRSTNASQGRTFKLSINGRTNDVIVNRVPGGFTRLGTSSSVPVNSTRIKTGETMPPRWQLWNYIPAARRNHDLPRWYNDL